MSSTKTCMLFAFNLQPDDYMRTLKLMRVFILLNLRMRFAFNTETSRRAITLRVRLSKLDLGSLRTR